MNDKLVKYCALLSILILLLSGCQTDNNDAENQNWEAWPQLVWGIMEFEKLSVLNADANRLEDTSGYKLIETADGYYMIDMSRLFYADKVNLSNWIVVCNEPDCDHVTTASCKSQIGNGWIAEKDGRIYFAEDVCTSPELYSSTKMGKILVSIGMDGSGKKLAYVMEEALLTTGGAVSHILLDGKWICRVMTFDAQGNKDASLYQLDQNGAKNITPEKNESGMFGPGSALMLYGDPCFYWANDTGYRLYRFQEETLMSFKVEYITPFGGYISGDILRSFRSNDGYYDINLKTGEEIKIADAQLENSTSAIVLPNCIIESTLLEGNHERQAEGRMEVFDGEMWRSVALPESFGKPAQRDWFYVLGVASDCILLAARNEAAYNDSGWITGIYKISLKNDILRLEYCGDIIHPVK